MNRIPSLALIALTFDFGPVEGLERRRDVIRRRIAATSSQKDNFVALMNDEARPDWQRLEAASVAVELQKKLNRLYQDENELTATLDQFELEFGEQMSYLAQGKDA